MEENISLIQKQGYIGHATPINGFVQQIKNCIIDFLETNTINTSDIVAIGCDGTVVNTGFEQELFDKQKNI